MEYVTADTTHGTVRGQKLDGVLRFAGMHYAAETSGAGRFLPPRPLAPWEGVKDALEFGDVAPQPPAFWAPLPESEDCLVVNVWTPATTGSRPVVFWIHGGGYMIGSGHDAYTDGTALARDNDVVVVSVNHRLGILGFLDLEGIAGPAYAGSGNASLLDLVAALEWVRDNIASFGGDPEAVTIFGHSGGASKIASLMAMPAANGLYRAAGIFGGPPFGFRTREETAATAREVLDKLGIEIGNVATIASVPLERLKEVQVELGAAGMPGVNGMRFSPVANTDVLPIEPYAAFAAGASSGVTVIAGSSLDEARLAMLSNPAYRDPAYEISADELHRRVAGGLDDPAQADDLILRYRALDPSESNVDLMFDILSDQLRVRTLRLVDAHLEGGDSPAYTYLCVVNHDGPGGAKHGTEVSFFFDTIDGDPMLESTPERERVAEQFSAAFARFARTGKWGSEEDEWPSFTEAEPSQVILDDDSIRVERLPYEARIRAWDGIVVTPASDPWSGLMG
jgi:para-nitrobenzyl esterase